MLQSVGLQGVRHDFVTEQQQLFTKYIFCYTYSFVLVYPLNLQTSLVAQTVKWLPTVRETWVQSLGWEDPLEKEMATHSSTLVWKIPWTEDPVRLPSMGSQRVGHNWATSLHFIL